MSKIWANVSWQRGSADFLDKRYSRAHAWRFDGGIEVPASSSPHVVPVPLSLAAAVDPEEAFVAALSSCHMLWFLSLAAAQRLRVDRYSDDAEGVLGKNAAGKVAMTHVTLKPRVTISGEKPTAAAFEALHHQAHERCYIANSVTTDVRVEPVLE
ncbi:MAG TPA: OsmC family protein [Steroidobacteraceae bacterium]|jgi:organic hydroperoxide reductase OsmC/OhrA